jgi:hypothetical protein
VSVGASPIVEVDASGQPFIDDFNQNRDRLRIVALVSPTCLDCLNGVRSIRRAIQAASPAIPIAASIVWMDVSPLDSPAEIEQVSNLIQLEDARQFHDPTGWTGRQIAASLGFPTQLAWDTFLFYRAGLGWNEAPPAPTDWAHQLDYSKWADPAHLCTGPALLRYLKAGIRTYAVRSNL